MNAPYLLGDSVTGLTRRASTFGPSVPRFGEQHSACGREILRLNSENAVLRDQLARERTLNEDLRRSAVIWIRLYEQQLARANTLAASGPAGPTGASTP